MKRILLLPCVLCGLLLLATALQAQVIYITPSGAGTQTGASWANSAPGSQLQTKINGAASGSQIWMAAGTYKPNAYPNGCSSCGSSRDYAFLLKSNVAMYGGFAGTETDISQRNFRTHTTILSGDIGTPNDNSDNCFHVVISISNSNTTVLDGCTITEGNANASTEILVSGTEVARYGGGAIYAPYGSLKVSNCLFTSNSAIIAGAAIDAFRSSLQLNNCVFSNNSGVNALSLIDEPSTITNCIFTGNVTSSNIRNSAVYTFYSNSVFTNCIFSSNSSPRATMGNAYSSPVITNCIFWGNIGGNFDNGTDGAPSVNYSIMQGGYGGTGNLSTNPLFTNASDPDGADNIFGTPDDGLKPQLTSPAINVGSNAAVSSGITTDITGAARIQNGTVDMGAYESSYSITSAVSISGVCVGATLPVAYTAVGTYTAGNTFTAQLSNAAGSFASPVSIGTVTATASSTITTTIPAGTATGSGYRVRVVSSNPALSGPDNGTNITVNTVPAKPAITAGGATTFCAGGSVTLTAPAGFTAYSWSNGATTQSITATQGGVYTVVVANSGCSSPVSDAVAVTVNPTPATPVVTASGSTTLCQGSSVTLTATAATTYKWYLNGNIITGATAQSYTASATGSYTVIVTNASGCPATSAATSVTVNPIPATPVITVSGTTTFCAGSSVTLTATAASSYQWYRDGNVINGSTTQSYIALATGSYTVTVTNPSGCSATSAPTVVTVSTPVTPVITASGSTTLCSGSSVTFTSSAASSYQWYLNGNLITGATAQSYIASAAGNYTVITTNAAGCPATSSATTVTVNPAPAVPIITTSSSTILCSGGSVTLTATAPAPYQWYLDGNLITGATAQSYTASTAGSYTVTTTNVSGCSATSAPAIVTVNTPPAIPVITASGSTTLCSGSTVTLSAPTAASNVWAPKAPFGGGARYSAVGFSIGSKGYVGTGSDGSSSYKKDFWEYDPATNAWTQKADFGGTARFGATGFSIGSKGYIGTGFDAFGRKKDFWEYDPASNTWVQKADFGGPARQSAVGFSIGGYGYITTGYEGNNYYNDCWVYAPSSNTWTQKADFGGVARLAAAAFSIGGKGYVGTGLNSGGTTQKDFWEYDPATNTWMQKTDFGGSARYIATGFSIGTKGYIGTGFGSSNTDFWEYNPATNTWAQKADFGGAGRSTAVGFSIGTKGYIAIGQLSNNAPSNDLYEYDPGYTYLWNPGGQTTPAVTTSTSGNYSLTLTNALGCSATSAITTVKAFPAGTVYVDGSRATSGDGSSWATAYTGLREALLAADQCSSITTINVAKGTYKPIDFANQDSAFVIRRGGLKLYGGYPTGGGPRNIAANATILSADIGTSATADNSYHIMVIAGLNNTADSVVVDGFTLTGGNATGTGSTTYNGISIDRNHGAAIAAEQNMSGKLAFRNLIFANNTGSDGWGAALVLNTSNTTLDKCIFYGNSTSGTGQGGAMWNNSSTTVMTNCLLYNNYGAGLGGAIQLNGSNPLSIINSTLYNNRTGGNGGAIRSGAGSVLNLSNTIFYKNDIGAQNGTYVAPGNDLTLVGTYTITNSMMQGTAASYSNTTNSLFGSNPLFQHENSPAGADNMFGTADDGFQLQMNSPAVNAGNNTTAAGISTDMAGAIRIQNGIVDMGAYESSAVILPLTLIQFSGKVLAGNDALLNWRTANEVNTSHFELQRSSDGRSFKTIAQVQAKGAAQSETAYTYTDKALQPSLFYYRLRMVDKDGKETYSAVVTVMLKSSNTITLYPVPAKDVLWLSGSAANQTGKTALLMDVQGRVLQNIRISQWPQRINVSALAPGTYLIKVEGTESMPFIKE